MKNGKSKITSIAHCTGYRHPTEDLKTDPERIGEGKFLALLDLSSLKITYRTAAAIFAYLKNFNKLKISNTFANNFRNLLMKLERSKRAQNFPSAILSGSVFKSSVGCLLTVQRAI